MSFWLIVLWAVVIGVTAIVLDWRRRYPRTLLTLSGVLTVGMLADLLIPESALPKDAAVLGVFIAWTAVIAAELAHSAAASYALREARRTNAAVRIPWPGPTRYAAPPVLLRWEDWRVTDWTEDKL